VSKPVKTDESRRRMPLHPDLLKTGFMRYVKRLQDAGETRLFHSMSRETSDRQAALRYAKQLAEMVPGNPNLSRLITELEAP
jgi:hypothetical protein